MDLKSMLNDSAPNRPPLTSSYSTGNHHHVAARLDTSLPPHHLSAKDRAGTYPTQSQAIEQRGAAPYIAQSPYQSSSATTSTWSAGPHSANAQSPVAHHQPQTPRDGHTQQPYNPSLSASPSAHTPQSAASATHPYHTGYGQHPFPSDSQSPPSFPQPSPSQSFSRGPNGISVHTSYPQPYPVSYPLSTTPLGPPPQLQKPLPHSQRPPSQGYDHHRTQSSGSIGSTQSRETIPAHIASPQQLRREQLQRQYSVERERSISVSPKTIPRPSPFRQQTSSSRRESLVTPMYPPSNDMEQITGGTQVATRSPERHTHQPPISRNGPVDSLADTQQSSISTQAMSQSPHDTKTAPQLASPAPSPTFAPAPIASLKTRELNSQSPRSTQPSLKRQASMVSTMSASSQPARKRLRRDEIPLFAQSGRPADKPIRFHRGPPLAVKFARGSQLANHPADARGEDASIKVEEPPQSATQPPNPSLSGPKWESITGQAPIDDITKVVCDWIYTSIGMATPPAGGAVFEIEAKIGEIIDVQEGMRIKLPVTTESVFDHDRWGRAKFESSMNMAQHRQLNEYLNNLVRDSVSSPDREPIYFSHPREYDEFFTLTAAGQASIPQQILNWLNPRHKPRVRKTFDLTTNKLKMQIIKSRIADLEIFNPRSDFDYRISISIEAPWDGESSHLEPASSDPPTAAPRHNNLNLKIPPQQGPGGGGGGKDRNKDRMSYRHLAYQIDLTQVSYPLDPNKAKEHELEVEISVDMLRRELECLRSGLESQYERMVRIFLENVRVLCRRGTVERR